jgi:hypothetical protein
VVTRRLWCDAATADYAREALSFPGLRVLARVDCETRRHDGSTTRESRYFAASLDPARVTPARLLELVRGHWEVEIPRSDDPRSDNLCVAGRAGYDRRGGPACAGLVA